MEKKRKKLFEDIRESLRHSLLLSEELREELQLRKTSLEENLNILQEKQSELAFQLSISTQLVAHAHFLLLRIV